MFLRYTLCPHFNDPHLQIVPTKRDGATLKCEMFRIVFFFNLKILKKKHFFSQQRDTD